MADLTRTKDPLEIAAASPDPAVRRLAIRVKEIKVELAKAEAFFAIYDDARSEIDSKTVVKSNGKIAAPAKTQAPAMTGTMAVNVRAILLERGPLSFDDLYARYEERFPKGSPRSREAFRVALTKVKDVGRVSDTDRRYWPVDVLQVAHVA